jgi:hypothetical protein
MRPKQQRTGLGAASVKKIVERIYNVLEEKLVESSIHLIGGVWRRVGGTRIRRHYVRTDSDEDVES